MAQVILGKSTCPLCEEILRDGQEIVAFPAFLPWMNRLWRFSDSAFHRRCFQNWDERVEYEAIYKSFRKIWENRPTIPEGMSFTEFEKTDDFSKFQGQLDAFNREQART